jgi:hypothetical protein
MMSQRIVLSTCLLLAACGAHAASARTYRFAELVKDPETGRHIFEQPAILEFQPGDRLPVQLVFSDEHFALDPDPPNLTLVAKAHCFVRIEQGGIRVSRDPRNFDEKPATPGTFFVGFTHDKRSGPTFSVQVRTPRRANSGPELGAATQARAEPSAPADPKPIAK